MKIFWCATRVSDIIKCYSTGDKRKVWKKTFITEEECRRSQKREQADKKWKMLNSQMLRLF